MIEKNNPRNKPDSFDHLVYVRIFEGCNLYCKHCFIPANSKKISLNTLKTLAASLSKKIAPGSKILLQWHGGEPTALGPEFLVKSLEAVEEGNKDYGFHFIHSIQTNLMNYDEKWRDVYKKYFGSSIGVSWDPKIRLIHKGDDSSNKKYEEIFNRNINKLVEDGIDPYLVVTGTKIFFETFKYPSSFFDKLEKWGIYNAHIERVTETGYARNNWDEIGLNNKEYSDYMGRFAKAYYQYSKLLKRTVNLSPFDGLKNSIERLKNGEDGGYGCLSGDCDSKFHTFDANGYKQGCTALTSEYDNKKAEVQVISFVGSIAKQRKDRRQSCDDCKFKTICSSGCLATNKFDESGECSGSYDLFNVMLQLSNNK